MDYKEIIAAAYDKGVVEEYNRLVSTPLFEAEYMLISELMDKYITNGSTVIDIGAGPGRYAEFLLKKHCKIGLVDLSSKSLEIFNHRIHYQQKANVLFIRTACASSVDFIKSDFADAVLLMGPMYHLIYEDERENALRHAYRILKPGGNIFMIFLSPYPMLNPLIESAPEKYNNKDFIFNTSQNFITKVCFMGYNVKQFRCWPSYAKQIAFKCGFKKQNLYNIAGENSFHNYNLIDKQTNEEFKTNVLNFMRNSLNNPKLLGLTEQFLFIGKK